MKPEMNKILRGQFFTTKNPFQDSEAYNSWKTQLPEKQKALEPFAGAGNLFEFIKDIEWDGYDIEPKHPLVIQQDTMINFPNNYEICITNPPYLAKTTSSRKKLPVILKYDDLYLDCLEKILENCKYVAVIIPSTFYGKNMFTERLYAWDKIDRVMFDDTDNPIGVAYFVPHKVEKTKYYVNGKLIDIQENDYPKQSKLTMNFNVENGNYILSAIDTTKENNIKILTDLNSFDKNKYLKNTSRNYSLFFSPDIDKNDVEQINKFINNWREKTQDFFLTSFKSEQNSGKYRKRISFQQFKWLVHKYLETKNVPT